MQHQEQHKCETLQNQIVVLNQQAGQTLQLQQALTEEKQKYQELYVQLTASEQQKAQLINKLEVVAEQMKPVEQCQPIIKYVQEAQQMNHINVEQFKTQAQQNSIQVSLKVL